MPVLQEVSAEPALQVMGKPLSFHHLIQVVHRSPEVLPLRGHVGHNGPHLSDDVSPGKSGKKQNPDAEYSLHIVLGTDVTVANRGDCITAWRPKLNLL